MKLEHIRIEGMTCNHCIMAVRKELATVEGVQLEDVRIGSVLLRYEEGKVNPGDIDRAIEAAGFHVSGRE
ncbi:MAG: heavy-metal-associated domain-containing protein [Bacteroidetes bacterium]|nr:heavy-metal-associated domain-containing protein [Bacteroidota bacterium]